MGQGPLSTDPKQQLKIAQTLVAALIMGVVMFAGVTVFLLTSGTMQPTSRDLADTLLPALAGLLLVTGIASFAIRGFAARQARERHDRGEVSQDRELMGRFMTLTIARAALHEGPALFGVVITLLTGNWLGACGAAIGLLLMLWVFPTRGRFESFEREATGRPPGL